MGRPYVTKIESNIKSQVVAQPGRKTLILGPNGAGKSAHVNSLEAAGSGKVSDVAGRALLAKDADLSMLSHADRVWATVKLSDGTTCEWEVWKGHRAKRAGPAISFPLRDVRDAILGSPETARKWVLEQASGTIEWSEVVALVPTSLHKRLESIVANEGVEPDATPVGATGGLTFALDLSRKRVREANAEAKAQRSVSAPPGPPPTDDEIARLEGIVKGWEAREAGPSIDSTREALKNARENAEAQAKRLNAAEAELAALGSPSPTSGLRRAAVEVAEALAKGRAASCVICGGACDPKVIANRAASGRAKIAEEETKAKRRADLEFALREANADLGIARREVQRLVAEEGRISRLANSSEALATPLPIPLDEAKNELRACHERRAGWAAHRRAEEKALEAEREGTEWSQLADALSKALGVLVDKSRVAFEARVQQYLPTGDVFGIDLVDGDREILRVGLRRSDSGTNSLPRLDAALSGAEWARVTAALALATAPDEGPCIICPEERAFDPGTLAQVLAAWDRAIGADESAPQVVITSPVEPTLIPAGWTVIRVGGEAQAAIVSENEKPAGKKRGRPPKAKPEANGTLAPVQGETISTFTPNKDENGKMTGGVWVDASPAPTPEPTPDPAPEEVDLFS